MTATCADADLNFLDIHRLKLRRRHTRTTRQWPCFRKWPYFQSAPTDDRVSAKSLAIQDTALKRSSGRKAMCSIAGNHKFRVPSNLITFHDGRWAMAAYRTDHTIERRFLFVIPGLVYRRDAIDRTHVGAFHQVDLWRIAERPDL